jgi:murein DD-endopeptidase MepM/ murein hydrolase activator NlpD
MKKCAKSILLFCLLNLTISSSFAYDNCEPYNQYTNPNPALPCSCNGYDYDSLAVESGTYVNSFFYKGSNYTLTDFDWWWSLESQVNEPCDGLIFLEDGDISNCSHNLSFNKSGALFLGVGASYTTPSSAATFIFPVLGISISDPLNNKNDPLKDGWAGKGVGQLSAADGHLGQDYYLKGGDSAGKPVFAIYTGEVVQVMNGPGKYGWCDDSDHGWGPVVVLRHHDDKGFKVSDNAITHVGNCSTDRNPKVVYSLYGHLSKDSIKNISVGQTFYTGDPIGVIGKYGIDIVSWTTNHLHFEIKDEIGLLEGAWYKSHPGECPGSAAQSCGAVGIGTGYSYRQGFAPNRYIPSVFILDNQGRKGQLQSIINLLLSD